MARPKTLRAAMACANWLAYCLSIGWKKSDLDALQGLWQKYHDENGNLKLGRGDTEVGRNHGAASNGFSH